VVSAVVEEEEVVAVQVVDSADEVVQVAVVVSEVVEVVDAVVSNRGIWVLQRPS
jgi:hypothetical protein